MLELGKDVVELHLFLDAPRVLGVNGLPHGGAHCLAVWYSLAQGRIQRILGGQDRQAPGLQIAHRDRFVVEIDDAGGVTKDEFRIFLLLLNPFAPHITEELWEMAGFEGQIAHAAWPVYDEAKCRDAEVEIAVQICGKVRGRVVIAADLDGAGAIAAAKQAAGIAEQLAGKTVVKEIYVPGKLVNIVAK